MSFKTNLQSIYRRPSDHLAPLDGLRALTILYTILFHSFYVYKINNYLHDSLDSVVTRFGQGWIWVINGEKGVDIFFVLSGFLISLILFKELQQSAGLNLRRFYLRRFLRLTPVLYLTIGIYYLLDGPNRENVWANMLYINNFLEYNSQALGWTWSLAVEEQFYLLYPLSLLVFFKQFPKPKLGLWLLLALSLIVITLVVVGDPIIRTRPSSDVVDLTFFNHIFSVLYDNLYTRMGSLTMGCLAAYYYYFEQEKVKRILNNRLGQIYTACGLGVILLLLNFPIFSNDYDAYHLLQISYYIFNRYLLSLGVCTIILAALCQNEGLGKLLRIVLSWQGWLPFARLSYSMYLIQLIVLMIVLPVFTKYALQRPLFHDFSESSVILALFLIGTTICMFIASIMYLLIEKPFMNMRR